MLFFCGVAFIGERRPGIPADESVHREKWLREAGRQGEKVIKNIKSRQKKGR